MELGRSKSIPPYTDLGKMGYFRSWAEWGKKGVSKYEIRDSFRALIKPEKAQT